MLGESSNPESERAELQERFSMRSYGHCDNTSVAASERATKGLTDE